VETRLPCQAGTNHGLGVRDFPYHKNGWSVPSEHSKQRGIDTQEKALTNKYEQQANKTQVLAKVKDFLTDLFYSTQIGKIIKQMLKILRKRLDIIRPGRSFPRPNTASRRRNKIMNSKGI
jgi:hypothetical protein